MPCIKVGLNEWILLNKQLSPIALWTDGIIGCVGVTIKSAERAFMAHIYSHISVEEWENKIKAEFKEAIERFGSFDKTYCWITVNRDLEDNKTPLEEAVEKTLREAAKGLRVCSTPGFPGMLVWQSPEAKYKPGFNFEPLFNNGFSRNNGFIPAWGELMNSVTGPEYIEAHGFFSSEGAKEAQIYVDRSSED
jgi:hypothetical protein